MYSPKIAEDLIPRLYRLKQRLGKPMTELVDEMLRLELAEMEAIYLTDETEETDEYRID